MTPQKVREEKVYDESAVLEAAERGDVEAQLRYGKMLCGLEDRLVERWFGDADGVHAVRYWDGTSDGVSWLKKAAAAGNAEAMGLVEKITHGDIHLVSEAEYCYTEAMRYILEYKDIEKAEDLLEDAADEGWPAAQRELAKLYLGITDPSYKSDKREYARELLEKASKSGDGEAQHRLAMIECEGDFSWYPYEDEAFKAGLDWLKRSAEEGDPTAQYQYGRICFDRADNELREAIAYWNRAYATGSTSVDPKVRSAAARAALELADLNYTTDDDRGTLFKPNPDDAIIWYEKAAALGSCDAADELGRMHYHAAFKAFQRILLQQGSDEDKTLVKRTYELTKLAAEAGIPTSQMRIAAMYSDGMGVEHDDMEARSWLLAAEQSRYHLAHECLDMILKQGMSTEDAIEACRGRIS